MNLLKTKSTSGRPKGKNVMLRRLTSVLLLILMLTNLVGCGSELEHGITKEFEDNKDSICQELDELWNSFLDEVNDWIDCFATHSITRDSILMGKRKKGTDDYVGSYEADYNHFTGKEFIFGGTALKRRGGSNLKATYSLTIQSGTAALYWLNGDNEIIFADISDEGVYEFTIHAGKNFIVLKGNHFTGSLILDVT